MTEEDVKYNTIVVYYNILLIAENEGLLNQNEERLKKKTLPIVKLQLEKGVVRKVDLDKVQVNYNNIIGRKQLAILRS